MKIQRVWFLATLSFLGSTLAHASVQLKPLVATLDVPEPNSTILGAGLLLAGLGFARRRLKK
jgi:PEP-CTERM motif